MYEFQTATEGEKDKQIVSFESGGEIVQIQSDVRQLMSEQRQVQVQMQALSQQIFQTGKGLSNQMAFNLGDASDFPLQCKNHVLVHFQEDIQQRLVINDELHVHLINCLALDEDQFTQIQRQPRNAGQVKVLLKEVDKGEERVRNFISSLSKCGGANKVLADMMNKYCE